VGGLNLARRRHEQDIIRPIILITALPDTHLDDEAIYVEVSRNWLQGNLAKAEKHLATLERICLIPCGEYDDLKRAIAAYRQVATR
jgi:hypothetical protein